MRLKCASTFLILLLPILFFYGCESTSSSSDGQGQEALPQSVETAKVELIRTQSSHGNGMGNGAGYYSLLFNEDTTSNIVYSDYSSQEQIYLCNRPECTHNDETCTSWLGVLYGGGNVFLLESKLLIIQWGSYSYVEEKGEIALPTIFTADLDGTNRKVCARLKATEQIEGGLAVSDNDLYFIKNILVVEKGSDTACVLTRLNLETGEETEIKEFSENAFLQGSFDHDLVIKTLSTLQLDEISEEEDWTDAINNTQNKIMVLDLQGNAIREITWQHEDYISQCFDDALYRIDLKTKELIRTSLATGETDKICTVAFEIIPNSTTIHQKLENYLIIEVIDLGDSPDQKQTDRFAVNCSTGETSPLTLKMQERGRMMPIEVWDEYKDYYYVCADTVDSGRGFAFAVGALISKNDYWGNNDNYIWLNNLVQKMK